MSDSALEHAVRYADRLPEREKELALGAYYSSNQSAWDRSKAVAAFQALFALDSTSETAAVDLVAEFLARDQLDSVVRYARIYEHLEPGPYATAVVATVLTTMGDTSAARATLDSIHLAAGEEPGYNQLYAGYLLQLAVGATDSARATAMAMVRSLRSVDRFDAALLLGNVDAMRGRVGASDSVDRLAQQLSDSSSLATAYAGVAIAENDILIRDQPKRGLAVLDSTVATPAWQQANPVDLPLDVVAALYAQAGNPDRAQAVLDKLVNSSQGGSPDAQEFIARARAHVVLARKNYPEALRQFRAGLVGDDGKPAAQFYEAIFGIAETFDRMGESDSARAWFKKYLAIPVTLRGARGVTGITLFAASPAAADKRLGELYDAANKPAEALKYYGAFVDQWKNADPKLQPVVTGVKQRMAQLEKAEGH